MSTSSRHLKVSRWSAQKYYCRNINREASHYQQEREADRVTIYDIRKKKNKPNARRDQFGRLRVGAAVGVTPDIIERIDALRAAGVDVISIDTAHIVGLRD